MKEGERWGQTFQFASYFIHINFVSSDKASGVKNERDFAYQNSRISRVESGWSGRERE